MESKRPRDESTSSREERESDIRRRSEDYGRRFCTEHGPHLGLAVRDWRAGETTERTSISVRVYDREGRTMRECTVADLLAALTVDSATGAPQALRPTAFGQVVLAPNLHVSHMIYEVLRVAWPLTGSTPA